MSATPVPFRVEFIMVQFAAICFVSIRLGIQRGVEAKPDIGH
jgi:hypothetical protein